MGIQYQYDLIHHSLDLILPITLGRTIIDEVRVEDAHKTIPPCAKFGGVAGGRKYFVEVFSRMPFFLAP
jgi:hypothetical protein